MKSTHLSGLRLTLSAITVVAAALLLVACQQPGPDPTASPEERDLLVRAVARATVLKSYSAVASVTIRYQDGVEKEVKTDHRAQFQEGPPLRVITAPGFFGCSDPLLRTLPQGALLSTPQTVCYRQPGDWGKPREALDYLANAAVLYKVGEETTDGQAIAHYRATFPRRPDLDKFRSVMIGGERVEGPLLMRDIYGDGPQTVDVWLGKEDLLLRRIDVVTTGLVYPSAMPEPNNLKGAVEERATVFFRDFDRLDPSFPFSLPTPTDLRAVPLPDRPAIQLTWSDNAENETAYVVQRSKASAAGGWEQIAFLPANSTGYVDENVTAGAEYFYRVGASGATTISPLSFPVTAVWVAP